MHPVYSARFFIIDCAVPLDRTGRDQESRRRRTDRAGNALTRCKHCRSPTAVDSPAARIQLSMYSKGKGSLYSITERRVPELIPVLGSQPAGDVSHKSGGRLHAITFRQACSYPRNR